MKSAEDVLFKLLHGQYADNETDDYLARLRILEEYAQSRQPVEEVTDEDIDEYVKTCPGNTGNIILDQGISAGFKVGAKWMRDKIK
jgi:hypothetical protein